MTGKFPDFDIAPPQPDVKIGIVRALWHGDLTKAIADNARAALITAGVQDHLITDVTVAGSFEIPLLCKKLIEHGCNGVIAVGILIKGETAHAKLIATSATGGLMHLQMNTGVPVIHEILLVDSMEQARDRATGPHAVGAMAAKSLLKSLGSLADVRKK